jgi:dipeptidyl aminopeptidase/acylaminoacyl peptidase
MRTVGIDDFHDVRRVSSPALSPDGSKAAYVVREPRSDRSYGLEIHIVDLETNTSRRFTAPHGTATDPTWSPGGDRLAFVSSRGETGRAQVWVAPADGGEAEPVTGVAGGASSLSWCPDGRTIAFLQEPTPDERRQGYDLDAPADYSRTDPDPRRITNVVYRLETAHRVARRDGPYYDGSSVQVYTVDVDAGAVERVTDGERDHYEPSWGSDSELYYVRSADELNDTLEFEVCVHDFEQGDDAVIAPTRIQPPTRNAVDATADGRVAYFYEAHDEKLFPQAEIRVSQRGEDGSVSVTDFIDRRPSDVPGVLWGPSEEWLYFGLNDQGSRTICRTRVSNFDDYETVVTGTHVNGVSVSQDRIALTQSEWDHPGDLFVAEPSDPDDGASGPDRITRVNEGYLRDRHVNEPEEIWFENDGFEVQGWVLTPTDFDPDETYPLVTQVHGGPPLMWTTSGTMWHEFQALADMGYVVFWSNPRGSLGYGEEFMRSVVRDWGGPYYEDVMAGVNEVVRRPYIDEDNLFITGGSYGGYVVGWAVGQTDRFRAAVAQRGVYDLKMMYGTSTVGKTVELHYGVHPWEDPMLLWEDSPVAHVDDVDTPIMIVQSEHDYNTPKDDSESFFRYLRKAGAEAELVVYPREGHELSRSGEPAHVVDRLERIAGWFDRHAVE